MTEQSIHIAILGFGNMGVALVSAWCAASDLNHLKFSAIDPSDAAKTAAKSLGLDWYASLDSFSERVSNCDVILLAIKPQMAAIVLHNLRIETTAIMSIMAGVTIRNISNWTGCNNIVRIMPNTPSQVGQGFSGYFTTVVMIALRS